MIYTTETTDQGFQESGLFDEFGDSYVQPATKLSLQYALNNSGFNTSSQSESVGIKSSALQLSKEIADLELEYFPANWTFGIFRNVIIYADK